MSDTVTNAVAAQPEEGFMSTATAGTLIVVIIVLLGVGFALKHRYIDTNVVAESNVGVPNTVATPMTPRASQADIAYDPRPAVEMPTKRAQAQNQVTGSARRTVRPARTCVWTVSRAGVRYKACGRRA